MTLTLERPSWALFWSGLAAGLSMAASLAAEGLIRAGLPEAQWTELVAKFGYCIGFLIVILGRLLGRQQLFTENTLTPMLPLLREKSWRRFRGVMRLWGIGIGGELAGVRDGGLDCTKNQAFDVEVRAQFLHIGQEALRGNFFEPFDACGFCRLADCADGLDAA